MKSSSIAWNGKQITKPGVYSGIPLDLYHSADICDAPSLSSSGMRQIFSESPAHFFAQWRGNPSRKAEPEKAHFVLGRAVHHLLLGERFFATLFAEEPGEYVADGGELKAWNNNAKYCRNWHAARAKEGRSVLKSSMIDAIRGMAESLGRHPIVRHGALNGMIERSVFWKDAVTGIWLKVRPDSVPGDSGDFVDLKTTDSVLWEDLVRTIGKFGYHAQGALIRRAAREVLKIENPTFTLIFVEKTEPFCVRVVTLKDGDLDRGDKQNRYSIDAFARCVRSKVWPGPGGEREDAEYIELSDREQKAIDDRLTILGN